MTDDHTRIELLENAITRLVDQDERLATTLRNVLDNLLKADQTLAERIAALERAAQRRADEEWREFCDKADAYLEAVEAKPGFWKRLWASLTDPGDGYF